MTTLPDYPPEFDFVLFDGALDRLSVNNGEALAIASGHARSHCWMRPVTGVAA